MVCAKGLDSKSKPTIKNAPMAHFLLLIQYKIFSIIPLRMRKFLTAFFLILFFVPNGDASVPTSCTYCEPLDVMCVGNAGAQGETVCTVPNYSEVVERCEQFNKCEDPEYLLTDGCDDVSSDGCAYDDGSGWAACPKGQYLLAGTTPKCQNCPSGTHQDGPGGAVGINQCWQNCMLTKSEKGIACTSIEDCFNPAYLGSGKKKDDHSHWVADDAWVSYPGTCTYTWECTATGNKCNADNYVELITYKKDNSTTSGSWTAVGRDCKATRGTCSIDNADTVYTYQIWTQTITAQRTDDDVTYNGKLGKCFVTKCKENSSKPEEGYHVDPTTVVAADCGMAGTRCEYNTGDASMLGKCDGTIHCGALIWNGSLTEDKWKTVNPNEKCVCEKSVDIKSGSTTVGKKKISKEYTGVGRGDNTQWGAEVTTVDSCIAGWYASGNTCVEVPDGSYSPEGETSKLECTKVELPDGTINTYWDKSANWAVSGTKCTNRNDKSCCYAECGDAAHLPHDNNGTWAVANGSEMAFLIKACAYNLTCNADFYNAALAGNGDRKQQCLACPSDEHYVSKYYPSAVSGDNASIDRCYTTCAEQAKITSATNGSWAAKNPDEKVYNGKTCAKILNCSKGYYSDGDAGTECKPCPAGSTTIIKADGKGAASSSECVMVGGEKGTQFCDKHGCFTLPDNVTIPFAG